MEGAAVQNDPDITLITPNAPIKAATHGGRAKCLQRLVRLDMPVPRTVALSFSAVRRTAAGNLPNIRLILEQFDAGSLLCVRPSSEDPDWGGPGAVLNIGMNDDHQARLSELMGAEAATRLYCRFVQAYAVHVARLDPDLFDDLPEDECEGLAETLRIYEAETEEPFPQNRGDQLAGVLQSMARAWSSTSARLLRQAKGAPAEAGLGLVVQQMIPMVGTSECGAGVLQLVDSETGLPQITGRYLSRGQGREALGAKSALYLEHDPRGPSLEDVAPEAFARLKAYAARMRQRLREEMQVEFLIENGHVHLLDGVRVQRSSRAAVRIAVRLAEDGIISREEAVLRIEPSSVNSLLHRQVAPGVRRDVLARGIAASPGAARGRVVFTSAEALASAAREEPCVLLRRETSPEDVRGMHAAVAVVTVRGGMSSHAAVIARGFGLPCIVGATSLRFESGKGPVKTADGRVLQAGDIVTVDGTSGQILAGEPRLLEAAQDDAFQVLMQWADRARDIEIRANADTPEDARLARDFKAQGVGLCRTEHMFVDPGRLTVLHQMIFTDSSENRAEVLARLLPMQREDFTQLFRIMEGKPVCIRLFDPPLHEFLPATRSGQRELAEALDLPVSDVTRRIEAMAEYNPMLGLRGVRLGVTVPEIYEMQARAIFEAALRAGEEGAPLVPDIMIPLVSAAREVELVRAHIDRVAAAVRAETGRHFAYRLGVMVETPRACLRAGEIAPLVDFLSFGTNDLTQMTYGLSRDDAGRFMSLYVQQGVYAEDPFHVLDLDGVGELLEIAATRSRAARPKITLSICGEHGGNPDSIAFCRDAGFDYVSCSPFRVPLARLAAAQFAIRSRLGDLPWSRDISPHGGAGPHYPA
ncbi:putative PEP-binding protein [Pontibaca methylaminivorans]|uniref:putative PEP-binding protein n=1 Tax=Pontibaca methylaminivorans TaxID=515897 RepID=UPI000977BD0C|nr:putative PEP-binding protein [Pontibaca methylaminivorans]